MDEQNFERIIRLNEVKERTALSRSTIYKWMADGHFPSQIHLGARAVGWRERDIENWIADRISG